ncbi:hypothetical protein [Christiangramia forsetii]|uniref:Uncharacterized protein n=2 Tax=Christiangramia forsetii TaxID=411153 RepID=A0M474_CHRFK|nr:hypothetical protein [Christiangramia forsetii]GGG24075.1 hypothetical protein GCM10011532_04120 [Christiangramia forsetii]CAL67419.1 hypothetical protein GFO_2463 [Christiangramia forsetii KT0803]
MKDVIKFLKKNGFKNMELGSYANDLCNVVINSNEYEVADNEGNTMYSKDHNIYWLIGVLTYYGFIEKNYKI